MLLPAQEAWSQSANSTAQAGIVAPQLLSEGHDSVASAPPAPDIEKVEVILTIGEDGLVQDVSLEQELDPPLTEYVMARVRAYRFSPAYLRGQARASKIRFVLSLRSPAKEQEKTASFSTKEPKGPPAKSAAAPSSVDSSEQVPSDEVVVHGRAIGEQMERGAEAVKVLELNEAHEQSADLGTLLGRSTVVGVQRGGGLGSPARTTMNGFSGDRIPVFVDGVPLAYSGFAFGVANVPVNLIDRIEIYQGVVPVRFAGDALTGAIHLVTDQNLRKSGFSGSYQGGSFESHRATLAGRTYGPKSGRFAQLSGFFDCSENDYPVDVKVTQRDGSRVPARVRRFHDGYLGYGVRASAGFVDRKWADRFVVHAYLSDYEKEIQNNATMEVPYGQVVFSKRVWGGHLIYRARLRHHARVDITAGYNLAQAHFVDTSSCRYGWRGDCAVQLPVRGEVRQFPVDRKIVDQTIFLRPRLVWTLDPQNEISAVSFATVARRHGDDAELGSDQYDTLNTPQGLLKSVSAFNWQFQSLDDRWQNLAFAKLYEQLASTQEMLGTGALVATQTATWAIGAGDSLRFMVTDQAYLKGAYEYATRLPDLEEVFGDGGLTIANLSLLPEKSHNANLGGHVTFDHELLGRLALDLQGTFRSARELIVKTTNGSFYQHQNVGRARSLGVFGALELEERKDRAGLNVQASYQDVRNRSRSGVLAAFHGDRIVNQPYLNASATLRLAAHGLAHPRDELALYWTSRYTHSFYRSWESAGDPRAKAVIPAQSSHDVSLVYSSILSRMELTNSVEIDNLFGARLYDFYGVQRPGRSVQYKLTVSSL